MMPISAVRAAIIGLALVCVAPSAAETIAYTFQVQAEARALGTFGDLGTATMSFTPERDAGFRVQGGGNVAHPLDAAAIYRYGLDMRFQLKGDQVRVLSKQNTSNKAGEEILGIVEEILPFVYLAQVLPRSPKGYTLSAAGTAHTLTYSGGNPMEVNLKRGPRDLARFFVQPGHPRGRIVQFRINRKSGTNLMFVPR